MTTFDADDHTPSSIETDPRRARSRARLLDAAASLLKTGGVEAITIESVTRLSRVARTTLYRHFGNAMQLRAATMEYLLPPVVDAPSDGPLRERLIELIVRQVEVINDTPMNLTTMLAWLATGEAAAEPGSESVRHRLVDKYRRPFDDLLGSPEAVVLLGGHDPKLALTQLLGPMVLAKLAGFGPTSRADYTLIVDDFLAARAVAAERGLASDRPGGVRPDAGVRESA